VGAFDNDLPTLIQHPEHYNTTTQEMSSARTTATLHRNIDGLDARFSAGYELFDFNFNANMRLTNKVSIEVDASSFLIHKHSADL
jgi:hypothetical protein